MDIPTPSFFKIRLTLLVIGFVMLCFVVGVVKEVFADPFIDSQVARIGECEQTPAVYNYMVSAITVTDGMPDSINYGPTIYAENGNWLSGTGCSLYVMVLYQRPESAGGKCYWGAYSPITYVRAQSIPDFPEVNTFDTQQHECPIPDPCQSAIDEACNPGCDEHYAGLQMDCGGPDSPKNLGAPNTTCD